MNSEAYYEAYKPLRFSLAYRMLGSVMNAEDIVHDIFADWERMHIHENQTEPDIIHVFSLEFASVNGFPGIVIFTGDVPFCTLSFHFEHGTIAAIYNTMNPDKLQHLHRK